LDNRDRILRELVHGHSHRCGFTQCAGIARAFPDFASGENWTWHFVAGLALFFCMSAYFIYLYRAGLSPRNALQKIRILFLPVAGKMRMEALDVILHWFVYAVILVLTITGIFLYLG
jgi:hypothetical protein